MSILLKENKSMLNYLSIYNDRVIRFYIIQSCSMDVVKFDGFAEGRAGMNELAGMTEIILAVSVVLGGLNPA